MPLRRYETHPHNAQRRYLWAIWMAVLTAISVLSIVISTFYFPSYYTNWGRRETSAMEIRNLMIETTSLGRIKYRQSHAIAWLLSFPNSGTTYTIANMEHISNQTTATNYAIEALSEVLHPLNPGYDAPFLFSPHLEVPNFVLTKSHCTGYCDQCHYAIDVQTVHSFEKGCRNGVINVECGPSEIRPYHGVDDVHKVVHLIRSPWDNIVSRMHLGVSERRKMGASYYSEALLSQFTDTAEGLRAWCDFVDTSFHDPDRQRPGVTLDPSHRNVTIPPDLMERLQGVPCHSEVFRYVQFHNLAIQMAEELLRLESPVHFLYYEDYATYPNKTSRRLAEYLEQPVVRPPLPFISGKTYGSFWTEVHRQQVTDLIRYLVTPKVWALLQRYLKEENQQPRDKTIQKASATAASEHFSPPEPGVTVESGRTNRTELVWFLSFPQSGSSMFMNNLMKMSRAKAASHYYQDAGPTVGSSRELVWPDDPLRSPFVVQSVWGQNRTSRMLTRNHCAGGCLTCRSIESFEAFDLNCRTVPAEGDVSHADYHLSRVREFWLLVRNPFDVIRSRTMRGLLSHLPQLGLTEEDVRAMAGKRQSLEKWCAIADQAYRDQEPPLLVAPATSLGEWAAAAVQDLQKQAACPAGWFSSQARYSRLSRKATTPEFVLDRELIKQYDDLPCFSDWVRIAQWYNYAMELTAPRRTLPRRIVRFEDYFRGRTQKLQDLVRALGLEPVLQPQPFNDQRARHHLLYSPSEARRAARFFKELTSPDVWNLFRPYFENQHWSAVGQGEEEGATTSVALS